MRLNLQLGVWDTLDNFVFMSHLYSLSLLRTFSDNVDAADLLPPTTSRYSPTTLTAPVESEDAGNDRLIDVTRHFFFDSASVKSGDLTRVNSSMSW